MHADEVAHAGGSSVVPPISYAATVASQGYRNRARAHTYIYIYIHTHLHWHTNTHTHTHPRARACTNKTVHAKKH